MFCCPFDLLLYFCCCSKFFDQEDVAKVAVGELDAVKRPNAAGAEIRRWLPWLRPFSLTKCSAIVAEVKGYFGIEIISCCIGMKD